MSAPKVHFAAAPPAYSPPPAYAAHDFGEGAMTFAQKERIASIAEHKLSYLVGQKKREPSLRKVLLHAGFLERVLDSIDASAPSAVEDKPLFDDYKPSIPESSYELHQSLSTIVEADEMEVDEEQEDEDMPALERTVSHRPGSPVSDDGADEDDESDESDDDELPSPPPAYKATLDHPLFNLFEVREKARREELSSQYKVEHLESTNIFFMNNSLAVAA
jgi:hypothetical protein